MLPNVANVLCFSVQTLLDFPLHITDAARLILLIKITSLGVDFVCILG